MNDHPNPDKLDDLAKRIHQAEIEAGLRPVGRKPSPETEPYRNTMRAYRIGTDFAVTVLASGGVGWLADHWLGTAPWGLLVMMVIGFVAGFVNLWRAAMKAGQNNGTETKV